MADERVDIETVPNARIRAVYQVDLSLGPEVSGNDKQKGEYQGDMEPDRLRTEGAKEDGLVILPFVNAHLERADAGGDDQVERILLLFIVA